MTFNFVEKVFNIGGSDVPPPLQFYSRGFELTSNGVSPSWQDIILSGNTALTLTNALANGLNYLKLFGACEQRNIPSEYTQVESINNNGTAWLDLGIPISSTDIITFDMKWNQSIVKPFFGAFDYGGSYSTQSFVGTYITTANMFCFYIDNNAAIGNIEKFFTRSILKWNGSNVKPTVNGVEIGYADPPYNSFTPSVSAYLFTRNEGGTAGSVDDITLYGFMVERGGAVIMNLIPARRNSDNVLGMYDTVTGNFLTNAGTGTFTAGADVTVPSPDTPMDIVCNNGVLKLSPNLFNKNDSDLGDGYISASTGAITGTSRGHTGYFKVIPNTTYYVTLPIYQTGSANGVAFYDSSKTYISGLTTGASYGKESHTFTVPSDNSIIYARLTLTENIANTNLNEIQIEKGSTGTPIIPYGQIYTDGTQEVVTDSLGNTANAEMLLSVGDYKDTQEVTSGNVTRNVGIKVLDGSENWGLVDGTTSVYRGNINYMSFGSIVFCTHYPSISSDIAAANMPNDTIKMHNTVNGLIYIRDTSKATAQDFSNYLADQYNAGTPVTIVYPLATATTETVTGQPLSIQAGTNIITAEGSIDNLELEVSYKATI